MTLAAAAPDSREPRQMWFTGMPIPQRAERLETFWSPEPIIGYRVWPRRTPDQTRWRGARMRWASSRMVARCGRNRRYGSPHLPGEADCSGLCGVNAFSTPEALVGLTGIRRVRFDDLDCLFGVVELSGKVIEHEDGYRGAIAEVVGLVRFHSVQVCETTDPGLIAEEFASARSDYVGRWTWVRYPELDAFEFRGIPHAEVVASTLRQLANRTRRTTHATR